MPYAQGNGKLPRSRQYRPHLSFVFKYRVTGTASELPPLPGEKDVFVLMPELLAPAFFMDVKRRGACSGGWNELDSSFTGRLV